MEEDKEERDKAEYRQVLKATGLFGGVQIIIILSGLVRSKIAAILIGPTGIGISSIYNNVLLMLASMIGLGIGSSAIREIAQTQETQKKRRIAKITQNLALLLSIAGLIVTVISAYPLSKVMFGDSHHILGFFVIAIAVFFNIFSTGYDACLKGFHATKRLVLVSVYSAILNVILSFVLFYIYGIVAIPAAIAINAMLVFILNYYQTKQAVQVSDIKIKTSTTLKEGKTILVLGLMLILSSLIDYFVTNTTNAIISHRGSLADLGLFQGAMTITTMSINMVLAAMANDYYPRLSKNVHDKKRFNETINIQVIIAMLLMVPILNGMIIASPILIRLFLSEEFLNITDFIHWILFGFMFMSIVWCLYYVPLAHGDTKRFLGMSIANAVFRLSIQIPGYLLGGLKGIAIGHAISVIIYALFSYLYINKIYNIKFDQKFIQISLTLLSLSSIVLITDIYRQDKPIFILLEIVIFCIISIYSYIKLNKYINIIEFIRKKIKK